MKYSSKINRHTMLCLAFVVSTCIGSAQTSLTATQWRTDLKYLQQVVHSKYSNLFQKVTATQFDSAVAALDKRIGTLNDIQMNIEMAKLIAMFQVGHTNVRMGSGSGNNVNFWVHPLPVTFYPFSDGLYIKSIHSQYKDAIGGKVTRIGKTDIATALEKIRPAIAFENEQGFKNMLQYYLGLPEYLYGVGIIDDMKTVSVSYEKNGQEKTIVLQPGPININDHGFGGIKSPAGWTDAYDQLNTPSSVLWLKEPGKIRYFEYLPATKTVYVRHSAVQDEPGETIASFFAKVFQFVENNDVEKFVLDIRLNGGGNNYLNKPVITGIIQSKKINKKGHLFIITGKATFSAAQNLTNELEKYTEAIFVGEPTSENVNFYGDTRTEILPESKLNVSLSWLWWQNLDPRDKRQWTAPSLATDLSFDNYKSGFDPAMNAIMQYRDETAIEDKIREQVLAGRENEALQIATQYLKNPLYRYASSNLENKLNNYGYTLINENKLKEANRLFAINVKLFPESANVYDSYAESFWKMGNKDEAIRYYNMAIAKDPRGATGDNARNVLKQIEAEGKKGF